MASSQIGIIKIPVDGAWDIADLRNLSESLSETYGLFYPLVVSDQVSCTRFRRHRVRCFMEQEVCHGETAVYAGVQA
jgi:hypothetical protein